MSSTTTFSAMLEETYDLGRRHRSPVQPPALTDLDGVPALTLLNPWAAAILRMDKRIENRPWMTKRVRRFMVHAGLGRDPLGAAKLKSRLPLLSKVPPGHIIAVVDVEYVCAKSVFGSPCSCGWWAVDGQYHWALGQLWTLAEPVPAKGRQKFWWPGPDLAAQVLEQIKAAAPLVCHGSTEGRGRRCGEKLDRPSALAQHEYETWARTAGWRFGPDPRGGRTAMCPRCAAPAGSN